MTDTPRSIGYLTGTEFKNGRPAQSISPQDQRDFVATMAVRSRLSVKQYNAIGNGVADDTAAIVATIAAAASGEVVTVPPGTYNISSTITISTPISLEVQSGATIFLANGSNCNMFDFTTNATMIYGGGVLDLNGANNTSSAFNCIVLSDVTRCIIKGLELKNFSSAGIYESGGSRNTIEGNYIHTTLGTAYGVFMNYRGSIGSTNNIVNKNIIDVSGDGVWSGGNGSTPPTVFSSGSIISSNQITAHRMGIEVWGGSNNTNIVNNNIVALGDTGWGWGISIAQSDRSTCTGNTVNAAGGQGIELAISSFVTATGNTINGNTTVGHGISISGGGNNNTITGNTIDKCTKGVYTDNTYTVITGNSITNGTGNGIEVNSGDHQIITGNYVQTSGTGIIPEECSFLVVTSNIVDAGGNGIQFLANGATTRDFMTIANNQITAAVNRLIFTGSNFGPNISYQYTGGDTNFNIVTTGPSIKMLPNTNVLINGLGLNEGGLWNGGVLHIEGGFSGSGGTMLNFKNDNAAFAQIGVMSHTLPTPYHGTTADALTLYSSNHDISLDTDGTGSAINFGTHHGLQASVVDTAIAVNFLTLTGAAAGNGPTLAVDGSDGNINLNFTPKGTGKVVITAPGASASNDAALSIVGGSATSQSQLNLVNNNNQGFSLGCAGSSYLPYMGIVPNAGFIYTTSAIALVADNNSGYISFATGASNGIQAEIVNTASAVNYVTLTGAASGNGPILAVAGADTNIDLAVKGKGTGNVNLYNGANLVAKFQSGGVNYYNFVGATTGAYPQFGCLGADTDIGVDITTKGAGPIRFNTNTLFSNHQVEILATASAVNFLTLTGAASGSAVTMGATGADSNVSLNLVTKGTGTVQINGSPITLITQTTQTASYTLVLADGGTSIDMNLASALNLTVPPNSSVAFPLGTMIEIAQYGAGQVTIVAGAGVTLRTPSSLTTRAQYSTVSLRKRATDEWIVSGDLT